MKVTILAFSPAGGTLKVAKSLEAKLSAEGHAVQLLDLTGNRRVFKDGKAAEYLEEAVRAHDLLCIGSPVYEKHVEMYVQDLFRALPKPGGKWGALAVPFFTYGGISSGVALRDAERLLRSSGRRVLAAMKVESSHIVTGKLKTRVNVGMPGPEAEPVLEELVGRISRGADGAGKLRRRDLDYQNGKERIICAIMKERMLHRKLYGRLTVKAELCSNCGLCVEKCPIQRIETKDGKAFMTDTRPECIHCFSCVNACPEGAVDYEDGEAGWAEIERIFSKVAREGSLFRSGEQDRSAVYPLRG